MELVVRSSPLLWPIEHGNSIPEKRSMDIMSHYNVDSLKFIIARSSDSSFPHTRHLHMLFESTALRYKSEHPSCRFSLLWLKDHFFDLLRRRILQTMFTTTDLRRLMTLVRLEVLMEDFSDRKGSAWTIKAYRLH